MAFKQKKETSPAKRAAALAFQNGIEASCSFLGCPSLPANDRTTLCQKHLIRAKAADNAAFSRSDQQACLKELYDRRAKKASLKCKTQNFLEGLYVTRVGDRAFSVVYQVDEINAADNTLTLINVDNLEADPITVAAQECVPHPWDPRNPRE